MKIEEIEVGKRVKYYSTEKREGEYTQTVIRSKAWELESGEVVCKIVGKAGGVSIKHLEELK